MTVRNYRKFADLPITGPQISAIKMAAKHFGISDEDYRDDLEARFGVRSCTKLTHNQATAYIQEFIDKGFVLISKTPPEAKPSVRKKSTRPAGIARGTGKVVAIANAGERAKIDAIAGLIGWEFADGFERWLKKRFDLERVRTAAEAYKVIEGLKKMYEHQMQAKHGKAWWREKFEDAGITEYIRRHCPEEYR